MAHDLTRGRQLESDIQFSQQVLSLQILVHFLVDDISGRILILLLKTITACNDLDIRHTGEYKWTCDRGNHLSIWSPPLCLLSFLYLLPYCQIRQEN